MYKSFDMTDQTQRDEELLAGLLHHWSTQQQRVHYTPLLGKPVLPPPLSVIYVI